MIPETTQLPPRSMDEPTLKNIRQFYVKTYDLNPAEGGIGYTDGCNGCKDIVFGDLPRRAHNNKCRRRIMESAVTNKDVAARVDRAVQRDVE